MKKYTRFSIILIAVIMLFSCTFTASASDDGRLYTLYYNNDYDFALRMPKLWLRNTEISGYESKHSIFKYQLNVSFYPEDYEISGIRSNVVTLFVIDEKDFTDKVTESGILPLFNQNGYTYAYKTYENIYEDAVGKRYDALTASLNHIDKIYTPLHQSDEDIAEAMLASFKTTVNSVPMSPVRKTLEAFGYTVSWDGDTQSVTAERGNDTYVLKVGSSYYTHNGKRIHAAAHVVNTSWTTYMSTDITRVLIDNAFESGRMIKSEVGYAYMFTSDDTSTQEINVLIHNEDHIETSYSSDSDSATIVAVSNEEWSKLISSHAHYRRLGESSDSTIVYITNSDSVVKNVNFWII